MSSSESGDNYTIENDVVQVWGTDNAEDLIDPTNYDNSSIFHVYGLGGDDTLRGGAGADTLDGGQGFDFLSGGFGNSRPQCRSATC